MYPFGDKLSSGKQIIGKRKRGSRKKKHARSRSENKKVEFCGVIAISQRGY